MSPQDVPDLHLMENLAWFARYLEQVLDELAAEYMLRHSETKGGTA